MKQRAAISKSNRQNERAIKHDSSAGDNAVALAPPDYGIEFVDRGLATELERARPPVQREKVIQRNGGKALKYGVGGALAGGAVGAGVGALVGSVVPGIGTAIGAAVGGAIGGLVGGVVGAVKGALTSNGPASPASPYTGQPYTDVIYAANRGRVAVDLDLDNYHHLNDAAKITKLFNQFGNRQFTYSMAAGGFDRFAGKNGDCKTLIQAFQIIADQEFGIQVGRGELTTRFLTQGGQTVDPNAIGNCDNGANWFFTNHYWATYSGTDYDLLFGVQGVNQGNYDRVQRRGMLAQTDGTATDIEYWVTTNGVIVWENIPDAAGPNPQKYRSDNTPTRLALQAAGYRDPG